MAELVSALWLRPDTRDFLEAGEPAAFVAKITEQPDPEVAPWVALEWLDVVPENVSALSEWAAPLGLEPAAAAHLLEHSLSPAADVTSSDGLYDGTRWLTVEVPFARLGVCANRCSLAVRRLIVIVGDEAIIRLWRPVTITGDPTLAVDPITIGHEGQDLALARGSHEPMDCLPSALNRQRIRNPPEALIDEVVAASDAAHRAALVLDDALLAWLRGFYAGAALEGAPDGGETHALSVLGETAHVLINERREAARRVSGLTGRLARPGPSVLPDGILAGVEDPKLRTSLITAGDRLDEAERLLSDARSELREAASLLAATAGTRRLRLQEEQAARTAGFERRVSILAGVITGPAVIAGLAGANVDFWPLPRHGGLLAQGSFIAVVLLAVLAGLATWAYLRPRDSTGA